MTATKISRHVEQAFRSCKTVHLEMRPIFLRREARTTRPMQFVVMLALPDHSLSRVLLEAFDVTWKRTPRPDDTLSRRSVAPQCPQLSLHPYAS